MRQRALGQRAALPLTLVSIAGNRNPVMRIGAFPEVQAEKAALRLEYAPTPAAKSQRTKSVVPSQGTDGLGVHARPSRRLADWLGDICAKRHVAATTASGFLRERWEPRLVHDTDSAVKQARVSVGIAASLCVAVTLAGDGLCLSARKPT